MRILRILAIFLIFKLAFAYHTDILSLRNKLKNINSKSKLLHHTFSMYISFIFFINQEASIEMIKPVLDSNRKQTEKKSKLKCKYIYFKYKFDCD